MQFNNLNRMIAEWIYNTHIFLIIITLAYKTTISQQKVGIYNQLQTT
jgi:hypothetical protein